MTRGIVIAVLAIVTVFVIGCDQQPSETPSETADTPGAAETPGTADTPGPGATSGETDVDDPDDGMPGPGRGPIIIVRPVPSSGTYSTEWRREDMFSGDPIPDASWGESGFLFSKAFGSAELLRLEKTDGSTVELNQVTLGIRHNGVLKSLVISRGTDGLINWSLGGAPLLPCDDDGDSAPPDCTGAGIPPEFKGTIESFSGAPPTGFPTPGNTREIKMQARQ